MKDRPTTTSLCDDLIPRIWAKEWLENHGITATPENIEKFIAAKMAKREERECCPTCGQEIYDDE